MVTFNVFVHVQAFTVFQDDKIVQGYTALNDFSTSSHVPQPDSFQQNPPTIFDSANHVLHMYAGLAKLFVKVNLTNVSCCFTEWRAKEWMVGCITTVCCYHPILQRAPFLLVELVEES